MVLYVRVWVHDIIARLCVRLVCVGRRDCTSETRRKKEKRAPSASVYVVVMATYWVIQRVALDIFDSIVTGVSVPAVC